MSSDINKLNELQDISFIDNITPDTVLEEMISDFQEKYYELTDSYEILSEFDKYRIMINAVSLKLYQAFQYIDRAGKMNLLKYSYGDYLENLGANRGVTINEAKVARCNLQFTLSQPQNKVIGIPAGTKATSGDGVYFLTEEYCEIEIGQLNVTTRAVSQVTGTIGNNYSIGQINILSEPIAYVEKVSNIDIPSGGEDRESDDRFRERIFFSPSGYSTAGPEDSYIYWVNNYSSKIEDIKVISPSDDTVQILVTKKNGEIPDNEFLMGLENYLSDSNIKPITEKVIVSAPEVVSYDISGTYYISKKDVLNVSNIIKKVDEAVLEYVLWQKNQIGKDINPYFLYHLLIKAGVKRVDTVTPTFTTINENSIAITENIDLVYGGIEDD